VARRGCSGWGYDDVLPYFRRSEHNSRGASTHHGTGGPLLVTDPRDPSPLSHDFVDAATSLGIARNPDFNGAAQDGAGLYQLTQKRGARWSAASAFLRPALKRPNVEVRTLAHATRVVVEGGRAVGVEADFGGRREVFRADREVLLCGGAVGTPQLLLLSGIGPADDLRALGVDVVVDAPKVGADLQDHVSAGVVVLSREPISYVDADKDRRNVVRYLARRRGPFASNIAEAGAFVRTRADLPAPDLQFHFAPAVFLDNGFTPAPGHGYTFGPCLLQPASRGSVSLRTADPLAKPVLRAGYYTAPEDLRTMVDGLRLALQLSDAAPLRRHQAARHLPEGDDDAGLVAHLRAHSQTLYHPTSTAAMGASDDAVLDPELRVRGVQGLRVVDASAFPTVPRGNTHAPVVMLAERAADLLRGVTVPRQANRDEQGARQQA
jgi:choline dehydrogenase